MNAKRLPGIDYAKVFSICLVVFYHTPPRPEGFGAEVVSILYIPVFFFIAGFLSNAGRFTTFTTFRKRHNRQQQIPDASFTSIFSPFRLVSGQQLAGNCFNGLFGVISSPSQKKYIIWSLSTASSLIYASTCQVVPEASDAWTDLPRQIMFTSAGILRFPLDICSCKALAKWIDKRPAIEFSDRNTIVTLAQPNDYVEIRKLMTNRQSGQPDFPEHQPRQHLPIALLAIFPSCYPALAFNRWVVLSFPGHLRQNQSHSTTLQ